ncbi:ankyrin repeat domain-containing protein 27-like isoform X2 [Rhynchophorus ferrugineus]|uniref:ankyrin repeat domain-containing protein 27-like isoform X2 n=1 Tax=Rhynchophorus ferrugineus TaxID=354439 RepID=UPI003FCD51D0
MPLSLLSIQVIICFFKMWSQYDEDLSQNIFFKKIKDHYNDLIKKSSKDKWIICVPKNGSYRIEDILSDTILDHVLIQENDDTFSTLNKRQIFLKNHFLKVEDVFNVDVEILFEETHYIEGKSKYKVWCIERPLFASHITMRNSNSNTPLVSIRDCMDFLYLETFGYNILRSIHNLCDEFWKDKDESFLSDNLQSQKDLVGKLYSQCLQLCFKSDILQEKCNKDRIFLDNIKVAVETYMQYCLGEKLMYSINSLYYFKDSVFNKTVRNSINISLDDLNISSRLEEEVTLAKQELSRINNINTIIDKINCLSKTFEVFSKSVRLKHLNMHLTSDDFLQIFVYLILNCNICNWIANLTFMKQFHFTSAFGSSDQNSFLLANFEGSIEFISSSSFLSVNKVLKPNTNDPNNALFYSLYEKLKTVGGRDDLTNFVNIELNEYFEGTKFCHPLCSCPNCLRKVSGQCNQKLGNLLNEYGQNFIIISCLENNLYMIELLFTLDLDINCRDYDGKTALHYAAQHGFQDILMLLINYGADVNITDNDRNTPLHLACDRGHENCVNGESPLFLATRWGFLSIVKVLLENGASVCIKNKRNMTVFKLSPNYYVTKLFKDFGADQSIDISMEQKIVTNSNINSSQSVPLFSTEPGFRKLNNTLHGIKPNNEVELKTINLALKAIENNDLPLTCFYLGLNRNPFVGKGDKMFKSKCHPLCDCSSCSDMSDDDIPDGGYPKMEVKMNVNLVNNEGFTCLHMAAKYGRTDILRILVDVGSSINLQAYDNLYTPLHLACIFQRVAVVKELLKCEDCNIDASDYKGNTALFYASVQNNIKLTELLLQNGANGQKCNLSGMSVLAACEEKNLFRIITLLKAYNVKLTLKRPLAHPNNIKSDKQTMLL